MLNDEPLATRFVSKRLLEASIPPEKIAEPGTYFVTVKSEGEPLPASRRAHLTVGFSQ